ncbi:MAG: hypothetical protein RLW62_04815 [Gammaproteobacteria bacterium]
MSRSAHGVLACVLLAVAGASPVAPAQQPFAYPNAGQPQAQQAQDRYECHQWAVAQSGFDPSTAAPVQGPPASPPPSPPQYGYTEPARSSGGGLLGIGDGGFFRGGGLLGDAATGAALGAAGGALAGDAGEGAAIGALASTVLGAFSRPTSRPAPVVAAPPPDYYYQQQVQAADQARQQRQLEVSNYARAFGACMTARDYTVN